MNFDYSPLVAQAQVLLSEHTTTTTPNEYVNNDYDFDDFGNTGSILPSASRTGNISMNHLTLNEEAHRTRTIREEEQARGGIVPPLAAFVSAKDLINSNAEQKQKTHQSQSRYDVNMEVKADAPKKKTKKTNLKKPPPLPPPPPPPPPKSKKSRKMVQNIHNKLTSIGNSFKIGNTKKKFDFMFD